MTATGIAQDKIDAYEATHYRVAWAGRPFVMRIAVCSPELADAYRQTETACALFITAYNPFGRARPDRENQAGHERLRADLSALSAHVAEGEGADPSGEWPPEKSFLALGVDRQAAQALGSRYDQDAVVWAGADAVPLLLLLR